MRQALHSPARAFCAPGSPARAAADAQYYELLDTVLRVLKAQPLTFLHVFHHAVVLVMAYGVRRRATRRNVSTAVLTRPCLFGGSGWSLRSRCR